MSRVAKNPVALPGGVEVRIEAGEISVKGAKGSLQLRLHQAVKVVSEDQVLKFSSIANDRSGWAIAGTTRALVNNMVLGVSEGVTRSLQLQGVGYRAQIRGKTLVLSLGFSHQVEYPFPEGIKIECPSQTEIVVSGIDKQKVGQVAADIRAMRPPEPYKGKGVRYAGEYVRRKESKKK